MNVLLGITGGIAAYKTPDLLRRLRERGATVRVVMTASASEFVTPTSLQAVSGEPVRSSLWDHEAEAALGHIELARWADLVLVAPATAEFLSRLANGGASDLLSTLCLATTAPIAVAPAMNHVMWSNAAVQANRATLEERGVHILGPGVGEQACGETGPGRMLDVPELADRALSIVEPTGALAGRTVLLTAGPTREPVDPVRYLTNRSSGKMGYALAAAARSAGARVILVSGPVGLPTPGGVERVDVETADQMFDAVMAQVGDADVFIASAAVADYRPAERATNKIKKHSDYDSIALEKNREVQETRAIVEHARGMERPLVALAERIRNHLAGVAVVAREEIVLPPVFIDRIHPRHDLHIRAREIPGKGIPRRADAELALRQVAELDSRFQRESESTMAMVRIDTVAVKLARATRRDDKGFALQENEAEVVALLVAVQSDHPAHALGFAAAFLDDANATAPRQDARAERERFLEEHLDHELGRARPATRGPSRLVMVGLVTQDRAPVVERQGQAQVLQTANGVDRPHRLDIGRGKVHRAARAQSLRILDEVVALVVGAGRIERLLVRARTGGGPRKQARARDQHVDTAPVQFDNRPHARRPTAQDERFAPINRNVDPVDLEGLFRRRFAAHGRHVETSEAIKDLLRDGLNAVGRGIGECHGAAIYFPLR